MKKLISGLVIGLLIGSASVTIAATNEAVQAVFAEFNLVINGETKTLETKPLVYNGTSYLPVKELSNLVGYDVTYLADSRTIELSKSSDSYFNDAIKTMNMEGEAEMSETNTENPDLLIRMEAVEGKIRTIGYQIAGVEESIIIQREMPQDEQTEITINERLQTIEDLKVQLKYWQDIKAQKESQLQPTE